MKATVVRSKGPLWRGAVAAAQQLLIYCFLFWRQARARAHAEPPCPASRRGFCVSFHFFLHNKEQHRMRQRLIGEGEGFQVRPRLPVFAVNQPLRIRDRQVQRCTLAIRVQCSK